MSETKTRAGSFPIDRQSLCRRPKLAFDISAHVQNAGDDELCFCETIDNDMLTYAKAQGGRAEFGSKSPEVGES